MNKKLFLSLFLLAALVPLAAAKLALAMGWFSDSGINRGQWLTEEIYPIKLSGDAVHKWHLVYSLSQNCATECHAAAYTLQQFFTGLGAKQDRLDISLIGPLAPAWINNYPDLHWQASSELPNIAENKILLLNPQGLALLAYDFSATADLSQVAKDMRADLLRLLKYDREGL